MQNAAQTPAGNLPLLLLRMVETVAARYLTPQEWQLTAPEVQALIARILAPKRPRRRRPA